MIKPIKPNKNQFKSIQFIPIYNESVGQSITYSFRINILKHFPDSFKIEDIKFQIEPDSYDYDMYSLTWGYEKISTDTEVEKLYQAAMVKYKNDLKIFNQNKKKTIDKEKEDLIKIIKESQEKLNKLNGKNK